MAPSHASDDRFQRELRATLATLQCLSEYAAEQGDTQSSSILHNAAALLSVTVMIEPGVATSREIPRQRLSPVSVGVSAAYA
ncbi:hypothetical protein [Muricoccus aerilatus]|uniref:hypothetical protein n=1 Tax=Muricoccus aerilatus TaxID=452982 RepID=UPI0005C1BC4E|nr:hypothetical protein [Roseomonas aerilata]